MAAWEEQLINEGYRITAPRRAIIETLTHTTIPLSPQEIREQAQTLHHTVGLVTVYRMLHVLQGHHLIRRVHRQDGCHGYMPASPGHHHAIICQCCGKAAEFPGENDLDHLIDRVKSHTGYHIDDHLLQLFGTCPGCQHRAMTTNEPVC
jgi:Fe2+ or Zn2+ uptake regulation protein